MSLELIDRLIEADEASPKKIAVVGDAIEDVWVEGDLGACQDGCPCFREKSRLSTPGGAAGAARQLENWRSEATLISDERWWREPVKMRFLHDGKIVFRHDAEERPSENAALAERRRLTMEALRKTKWDGVLISDYDKGLLNGEMIREVITFCRAYKIPCVADAKRAPEVYRGAIIKCNEDYAKKYHDELKHHDTTVVVTRGPEEPIIINNRG